MNSKEENKKGGKLISSEIRINASPQKIWAVLTDFQKYPEWNPFIKTISGEVSVGDRIKVKIEPPGSSAMTFKPEILVFEPNKELRWLGNLLFPGLFDGEHKLELIDNQDGTAIFRQSETFRGILVPLFKKMLDNTTMNGFNLMNQKLKELAESN